MRSALTNDALKQRRCWKMPNKHREPPLVIEDVKKGDSRGRQAAQDNASRGMKFENVSYLIARLEDSVQEMGFCWRDEQGVICRQNGVFRVNCIDCLDRTNVVQAINYEGDALLGINDRPVIGILAQDYYPSKTEGGADGTYIAASYVKMVEASGARVVPIMTGKDRSYYEQLVKTLNGILLPGGGVDLWAKGGYGEASQILYELVLEVNRNGTHFPLYGVCLGLEVLAVASSNMSTDVLSTVVGLSDKALNLDFLPKKSGLYSKMPKQLLELLKTKNITSNHHSKSFTQESLRRHNLEQTWSPLTINSDSKGTEFISSMEHVQYPHIFGTQFHPEKIPFEWTTKDPHSLEAILPNRYFYDYFVEHARHNDHTFRDGEVANLIYKYSPKYMPEGYFQQIYVFKDTVDYVVEQVD